MSFTDIFGVLWLGILLSVSPCPFLCNIVSVSYIAQQSPENFAALKASLLFALGRTLGYVLITSVIVTCGLKIPLLARFLTNHMEHICALLFILGGIILLNILPIPSFKLELAQEKREHLVKNLKIWSSFPLGILLALNFCPISAGLFFGSLIPIAMYKKSPLLIPSIFGIGTSILVVIIGCLLAKGLDFIGNFHEQTKKIEKPAQTVTGIILLVVGLWMLYQAFI